MKDKLCKAKMTVFSSCLLSLVLLYSVLELCTIGSAQSNTKILYRDIMTVAGIKDSQGMMDTNATGFSRFENPTAICLHYTDNNTLFVSDRSRFRDYNITNNSLISEPNWNDDNDEAWSCKTAANSVSKGRLLYFTTSNNYITYMNSTNVTPVNVSINYQDYMLGMAYYNNIIYTISRAFYLYRCRLESDGTFTKESCTNYNMNRVLQSDRPIRLEVTRDFIYVAADDYIAQYRYTTINEPITHVRSVSLPKVKDIQRVENNESLLIAANGTSLFYLYANAISMTLDHIINEIDCSDERCIENIYPRTEDDIYFTNSEHYILRRAYLPDNTSNIDIPFPPFPVLMVNISGTMPLLYTHVTDDIFKKVNYAVKINENVTNVNDETWTTQMQVLVPQRRFDAAVTPNELNTTDYSDALNFVKEYYDRTNQNKYVDLNILPFCNTTEMWWLQRFVALWARYQLEYPVIYANPFEFNFNRSTPNITRIKILLPESFAPVANESANTTTPALLNFGDFYGDLIKELYVIFGERAYHLIFPGAIFYFDKLNPNQINQLRWVVQQAVLNRLAFCARESGDITGGGINTSNTNGLVPDCHEFIGITNMTRLPLPGIIEPNFTYDVFIPLNFNYTFNITDCLNKADWSDIIHWIDDLFASPSRKTCGTGCIVGIAVACAVIATMLAILLIVLVSKRRRLAVVLAPPPQMNYLNQPKFVSSMNMEYDESDEVMGSHSNPLVTNNK